MDEAVRFTDIAIIFATLLGPVLAVQAQKWLEHRREVTDRRMAIFRTLMTTRATQLARAHVEALNATPIEFYGRKRALTKIIEAWRLYNEHMNRGHQMDIQVWMNRRDDLYAELLQLMGSYLGYSFDKIQIRTEIYNPVGHSKDESQKEIIRDGLAKLLSSQQPLQMDVKGFPVDPVIREVDIEIRRLLLAWLRMQLDDSKNGG